MQPPPPTSVTPAEAQDRGAVEQPVSATSPLPVHTKAVEGAAPKVKPAAAPLSPRNTGVKATAPPAVVGSAPASTPTHPSAVPLVAHKLPWNTPSPTNPPPPGAGTPSSAVAAAVMAVGGTRASPPPPDDHTMAPSEATPVLGAPDGPLAAAELSNSPAAVARANTRDTAAAASEVLSPPPTSPPSGAS